MRFAVHIRGLFIRGAKFSCPFPSMLNYNGSGWQMQSNPDFDVAIDSVITEISIDEMLREANK